MSSIFQLLPIWIFPPTFTHQEVWLAYLPLLYLWVLDMLTFWLSLVNKKWIVLVKKWRHSVTQCLISFFQFWDFPSIFVQLKLTANFSFSKNHQIRLLLWFSNTVRVCLFTAGVLQHFVTFSGIATVSFRDLIIISKMSSAPHYSCFCE